MVEHTSSSICDSSKSMCICLIDTSGKLVEHIYSTLSNFIIIGEINQLLLFSTYYGQVIIPIDIYLTEPCHNAGLLYQSFNSIAGLQ